MSANPGLVLLQGDPTEWPLPAVGKTAIGVNESGALTIKQHDGSVIVFGAGTNVGFNSQASAAGQIDVTVAQSVWTEVITLSGSARTIPIVVALDNLSDGVRVFLKLKFPTLPANSIIQIYSEATLLAQIQTDGVVLNASLNIYGDGGVWVLDSLLLPATA